MPVMAYALAVDCFLDCSTTTNATKMRRTATIRFELSADSSCVEVLWEPKILLQRTFSQQYTRKQIQTARAR